MHTFPALSAPLLFVLGLECLLIALFRAPLTSIWTIARQRRQLRQAGVALMLADRRVPLPALDPQTALRVNVLVVVLMALLCTLLLPPVLAVMLALPLTLLVTWMIVLMLDQRQRARMEAQTVDAAARVSAAMIAGATLPQALRQTAAALPEPLATPWRWLLEQAGSHIAEHAGALRTISMVEAAQATAEQVVAPLLTKFLLHVVAALEHPQPQACERMAAVAAALRESRLRQAAVRAKLTHSRMSGFMIVGVGGGIGVFLFSVMHAQWVAAFASPFAPLAIGVLTLLFGSPLIGIPLLSRMPRIDF